MKVIRNPGVKMLVSYLKKLFLKAELFTVKRMLDLLPIAIKRNLLPPPGLVKQSYVFSELSHRIAWMMFFY